MFVSSCGARHEKKRRGGVKGEETRGSEEGKLWKGLWWCFHPSPLGHNIVVACGCTEYSNNCCWSPSHNYMHISSPPLHPAEKPAGIIYNNCALLLTTAFDFSTQHRFCSSYLFLPLSWILQCPFTQDGLAQICYFVRRSGGLQPGELPEWVLLSLPRRRFASQHNEWAVLKVMSLADTPQPLVLLQSLPLPSHSIPSSGSRLPIILSASLD